MSTLISKIKLEIESFEKLNNKTPNQEKININPNLQNKTKSQGEKPIDLSDITNVDLKSNSIVYLSMPKIIRILDFFVNAGFLYNDRKFYLNELKLTDYKEINEKGKELLANIDLNLIESYINNIFLTNLWRIRQEFRDKFNTISADKIDDNFLEYYRKLRKTFSSLPDPEDESFYKKFSKTNIQNFFNQILEKLGLNTNIPNLTIRIERDENESDMNQDIILDDDEYYYYDTNTNNFEIGTISKRNMQILKQIKDQYQLINPTFNNNVQKKKFIEHRQSIDFNNTNNFIQKFGYETIISKKFTFIIIKEILQTPIGIGNTEKIIQIWNKMYKEESKDNTNPLSKKFPAPVDNKVSDSDSVIRSMFFIRKYLGILPDSELTYNDFEPQIREQILNKKKYQDIVEIKKVEFINENVVNDIESIDKRLNKLNQNVTRETVKSVISENMLKFRGQQNENSFYFVKEE